MDEEKPRGFAERAGSAAGRLSTALSFMSAAGVILAAMVLLPRSSVPVPEKVAAAPTEQKAAAHEADPGAVAPIEKTPGEASQHPAPADVAAGQSVPEPAAPAPKVGKATEATGLDLIRARLVEVTEVAVKTEQGTLGLSKTDPAKVETIAARSRNATENSSERAPSTTWDGKPVVRPQALPPAVPAGKPAVDAAPGTARPGAVKPGAGNAEPVKTLPAAGPGADKAAGPGAAAAGANGQPAPEPPKDVWTDAEIATALRECLALLGPVAAEIEPAEPMRKGACGAPAPVKLKSVGQGATKVEFTPSLEVNCKLAVKVADWTDKHLQPAATQMLGSSVKRISGGGGYACRNRYGLAVAPLSEHALANAVDLPAFVLADGRTIKVASDWGPTDRDIAAAKIAAAAAAKAAANAPPAGDKAKVEAEQPADTGKKGAKAKGKKPDASAGGQTASGKAGSAPDEAAQASPAGAEAKVPGKKGSAKGKAEAAAQTDVDATAKGGKPGDKRKVAALKGGAMQNLGAGATLVSAKAPVSVSPEDRDKPAGKFLRRISQGACATFGTVLGPEANDAHRDHFHFDMKERKRAAYCQ